MYNKDISIHSQSDESAFIHCCSYTQDKFIHIFPMEMHLHVVVRANANAKICDFDLSLH